MTRTADSFTQPSPDALLKVHPERSAANVGGTALDSFITDNVGVETFTSVDYTETFSKEIEIGGRKLLLVSFFDGNPDFADLADAIAVSRQEEYKRAGLLERGAKEADDIRGSHVEIYALLDPETGAPVASLRKVHAIEPGAVHELPSHQKFAQHNAFNEDGLRLLHERASGRPVVEIAALWNAMQDGEATLTLYRKALHDSIERGELWFMGVVTKLHRGLQRNFGKQVIRSLGEPTTIDGEDATEKVRIHPDMVDPLTFLDDLLAEVNDAKKAGKQQAMYDKDALWWFFADELSDITIRRLGVKHES